MTSSTGKPPDNTSNSVVSSSPSGFDNSAAGSSVVDNTVASGDDFSDNTVAGASTACVPSTPDEAAV